MMLGFGFIALVPAAFIVWLALSKKTSPALKRFSIIALMVICLAFIVCTAILLFTIVFSGEQSMGYGAVSSVPGIEPKKNISAVLIAAAAVSAILVLVLILAIRERRGT